MSIPSSSDEVATRQGIRPAFSSSSISTRCSRASEPWWARAIALVGELVEPHREPFGEPPVVDEHDRGAVLSHEVEQGGVDRRPDRPCRRLVAGRHRDAVRQHGLAESRIRAGLAHVLERDDDLEVELLAGARVDQLDRPAAGDEASDLLQRALGRGEADALKRLRR